MVLAYDGLFIFTMVKSFRLPWSAPEMIDEDAKPDRAHDPKDQFGLEFGKRSVKLFVCHVLFLLS
jgi:hypothetical protein